MLDKKVLVIDDEIEITNGIKALLETEISTVLTASNGQEGIDIYNKHKPFDCIISDIKMPKMNGFEVIKYIRKQNDHVPFIFFTAFGTSNFMKQAAQYGAYDFLTKPFFDSVEQTVLSALKYKEMNQEEHSMDMLIKKFKEHTNKK